MPAVVLLAGGKKYSPHGASQFFALQKTEWFRLTGCSLKEKAGVESDDGKERVTFFCSAISKLLQSLRRCRASSLCTREPLVWFVRT